MQVHVLVCEAFHGPKPEGMEVLHRDNDRENPSAENLFWGTRSQNNYQLYSDAIDRNEYEKTLGKRAKLTIPEVHEIRVDPRDHEIIAECFGISRPNVSMIKARKRWANV